MWRPPSLGPTRDPSRWLRASQDLGSWLSEPVIKTLGSMEKWSTASLGEINRVSSELFCQKCDILLNPHCVSLSLFLCLSARWVHGFSSGGRASGEKGCRAGQRDNCLLQYHCHSPRPGHPISQQLGGSLLHQHTHGDGLSGTHCILLDYQDLASFASVL